MRNTLKKVLSVMLCFVMIFSTAAFAFAADNEITYSAKFFQKTSTDAKNADIVLDKIDEVLKEQNIYNKIVIAEKTLITKEVAITIDLRSVNGLCKTVDGFKDLMDGGLWTIAKPLVGDLKSLNLKNWQTNMKRGSQDITILNELLELLKDNAGTISKIVDNSIDLGVLKNFVDLSELLGKDGVYGLVKGLLVGLVYTDKESAQYKAAYNKTLDNFIYQDVLALINKEDGVLPGFTMNGTSTVDNLLLNVFISCYNKYIVEFIGKLTPDIFDDKGNEALIKLKTVINFDGSKFTKDTVKIDKTQSFSSQINNIVGDLIKFFVPGFTDWTSGDKDQIAGNLTKLYRYLAGQFGLDVSGEDKDIAVDVINYVLKVINDAGLLPGIEDYVGGVNDKMTIEDIITLVLANSAKAQNIPVKAGGNYEQILGDMLGYAVKDVIEIGYKEAAGKDIWTVLNEIMNVFLIDKGFAAAFNIKVTAKDIFFKKVDTILKMTETKLANYSSEEFVKGLLKALFNFDIADAVERTVITFLNDYAQTSAIEVIYKAVYSILKNAMGKQIIVPYSGSNPLDNAIKNSSLKSTVENLLTQLNANKSKLLPPVLYVGAMAIYGTQPYTKTGIAKIADQTYTGKAITPAVTVTLDGKTLKKGTDYTVEYSNNIEIGKATVTVTGKGAYKGTKSATFNIVLGKVANLKAAQSTTSATLTWNTVVGATSYQVTCNGKTQTVKTNKATVSGLTTDKKYTATVKAIRGNASTSANVSFATNPVKPAKVSGVKASSLTASSAKLTWSKASSATGYQVYYSTDAKTWKSAGTTSSTSLTVSKLAANKAYTFKIRAINKGKVSSVVAYGDYSSNVKATTKLSTPTSFKITSASQTSAKLSWAKVSGAVDYVVEYSTNGKSWSKLTVKTNSATISKLKTNTAYQFRVMARSKTNSSAYSSVLKGTTAPAKVTGVKVTSTTSTTAKLTWSKTAGATGYRVSYSADGKKWSSIVVSSNSATVSKLASNKTYQFKVSALKKSAAVTAEGTASSVVKAATKVAAPTGLKATKTDKSSVTLSWKKVSGASGYVVYRNGKAVGTINGGSKVSFVDKKLKRRTTYKYQVVAFKVVSKKNVYGNKSSQISAKTK